ncbi:MAG: hypothetical protein E7019_05165 [Alphaproteobacteria bacterium]|nr:hypothetical protein [Alphaproteobacteria bacterium]
MNGLSMCIAGLLGILIFSAWCIVLKDDFNRHLKLMEEHGVKGPREIVSWLLSAREKEQEDLLTYLHRDDLSKICDAFLIHIENYPEDTKAKSVYQRLKIFV